MKLKDLLQVVDEWMPIETGYSDQWGYDTWWPHERKVLLLKDGKKTVNLVSLWHEHVFIEMEGKDG